MPRSRKLFATNMRAVRISRNLSQEDLADACGLHRTYIGSVERCERNISIDNMEKIATALGVELQSLLSKAPR
jgi:transcriptional regulator with XRE-family HTH domain